MMPKEIPQPVQKEKDNHGQLNDKLDTQKEPLSGSKKVKNRNHSRNNHGEGS